MTMGGDVYYTSPENLSQIEDGIQSPKLILGKKSDIWALGVFLVEMCRGGRISHTEGAEGVLRAFAGNPQHANELEAAKNEYPKLA